MTQLLFNCCFCALVVLCFFPCYSTMDIAQSFYFCTCVTHLRIVYWIALFFGWIQFLTLLNYSLSFTTFTDSAAISLTSIDPLNVSYNNIVSKRKMSPKKPLLKIGSSVNCTSLSSRKTYINGYRSYASIVFKQEHIVMYTTTEL